MQIKVNDSLILQAIQAIKKLSEIASKHPLDTDDSHAVAKATEFRYQLQGEFHRAGGTSIG